MKKLMMYLVFLSFLSAFVSCEKWLTIQPENEIEKSKLFQSEEGFWHALNGVYGLLIDMHAPETALQAVEIEYLAGVWEAGSQTVYNKLSKHEYKDSDVDNHLAEIFLYQYKMIAHVNTILEYIGKVDFLPEKSYNLLKGESLALRAWFHFDLIRLWGPVPGNIDEKYRYLPYVKQVSKKVNAYDTYDLFMRSLISDLDSAELLLGKSEPLLSASCEELNSNLVSGNDRFEFHWRQNRFNYFAVLGLRARAALWMRDKEKALKYARMVKNARNANEISKFRLGLASDINIKQTTKNDNTLKSEHLFSYFCRKFAPDSWWNTTPRTKVDALYKNKNDFRYSLFWIFPSDTTLRATYKYRASEDIWVPLVRLAEMYLIEIECATLDEANLVYEEFCTSRGSDFVPLTSGTREETVLTEYYKEFFAEGQIFYANKRLGIKKMLWCDGKMADAQYVLPIPRRENEIFN